MRTGFKRAPVEPVKIDQVWQYGPNYHRGGRFIVKARIGPDFWQCQELLGGAPERNYTTDDILHLSTLTQIQPGQLWEDHSRRVCTILAPLFGYHDGWKFRREDLGDLHTSAFDPTILAWTLIDASAAKGGTCPLCGSRGAPSFNMFECSNSSCRNYRAPRP